MDHRALTEATHAFATWYFERNDRGQEHTVKTVTIKVWASIAGIAIDAEEAEFIKQNFTRC